LLDISVRAKCAVVDSPVGVNLTRKRDLTRLETTETLFWKRSFIDHFGPSSLNVEEKRIDNPAYFPLF
jgi:hypothetical protein